MIDVGSKTMTGRGGGKTEYYDDKFCSVLAKSFCVIVWVLFSLELDICCIECRVVSAPRYKI